MNILLTSAGRRVSLVRAFQKELGKIAPKAHVITADAQPELSAACQASELSLKVPRIDAPNYMEELLKICLERDIKLIIPNIDTELLLLSENLSLLEENGIRAVISNSSFIKKCRNKRLIHSFFESKGIGVAKEYDKQDYELPMFIKPFDGSRSVDTFIIRTKDDLRDYHFTNQNLMFLEYLDHEHYDEYTCDLYYGKDHQLKCAVPRKRLEVRDGEVNKALTKRNQMVPFIRKHLDRIDGAVGCLTTQFFKHKIENTIYGIEINPRFGGGFPLTYLSGANYPGWIIREYILGEDLEENFDCWESDLMMLRYDDEILVHGHTG